MLKNGTFCEIVILVVLKVFLLVKNLEILIQIVPDSPIYYYWGSYIISIAKTVSKKIGALIRSMKFLSPEVALYLYKSTIHPCKEYCCHIWAGAPSSYLELSDKLQKQI